MTATQSQTELKERHCPSCATPVKRFAITGLYLPFEGSALWQYSYISEHSALPFVSFGEASYDEWFRLCFSSECKNCGLLSLWHLKPSELDEIIRRSKENTSDGYAIEWFYHPPDIQKLIESIDNERLKEQLQSLLTVLSSLYPATGEE